MRVYDLTSWWAYGIPAQDLPKDMIPKDAILWVDGPPERPCFLIVKVMTPPPRRKMDTDPEKLYVQTPKFVTPEMINSSRFQHIFGLQSFNKGPTPGGWNVITNYTIANPQSPSVIRLCSDQRSAVVRAAVSARRETEII